MLYGRLSDPKRRGIAVAHPFVSLDPARDAARTRAFHEELFDWEISVVSAGTAR